MTIRELIAELRKYPPDALICVVGIGIESIDADTENSVQIRSYESGSPSPHSQSSTRYPHEE